MTPYATTASCLPNWRVVALQQIHTAKSSILIRLSQWSITSHLKAFVAVFMALMGTGSSFQGPWALLNFFLAEGYLDATPIPRPQFANEQARDIP